MSLRRPDPVIRGIEAIFGFLVAEYGCRVVDRHDGSWVQVSYENSTTFVKVMVDRDVDVFVQFGPLEDESPLPRRSGYDILLLANARSVPWPKCAQDGFPTFDLKTCLTEHADLLRKIGADVLSGDFSVLPELAAASERLRSERRP